MLRAELESVRRALAKYEGNLMEPWFDPLFAEVDAETLPAISAPHRPVVLTLSELNRAI